MPTDTTAEKIKFHSAAICQTFPSLDANLLPAYIPSSSPLPTVQETGIFIKLMSFKQNRSSTPTDLPMKQYREFAPELVIRLCLMIIQMLTNLKILAQRMGKFLM